MTQEEILNTITPQVIEQEAVSGGHRPKVKRYLYEGGVLDEVITYAHPANSDAWAAVSNVQYVVPDLAELQVYRTWNISNHPTESEIYRTASLVNLSVDALAVKVQLLIKHFTDEQRTTPALIIPRLRTLRGENDYMMNVAQPFIDQGYPAQMGERDYWHLLTSAGMTPYQLLDARIPEVDALGLLNSVYNG